MISIIVLLLIVLVLIKNNNIEKFTQNNKLTTLKMVNTIKMNNNNKIVSFDSNPEIYEYEYSGENNLLSENDKKIVYRDSIYDNKPIKDIYDKLTDLYRV